MTKPPEIETLERTRRIETRLTGLMIALGVSTQGQKPIFDHDGRTGVDYIILPSIHSSLKEILDAIPENWHTPVGVFLGETCVATVSRPLPT